MTTNTQEGARPADFMHFLLRDTLDEAVNALIQIPQSEWKSKRKEEILKVYEIDAFLDAFRLYRQQGALSLNSINAILASRASKKQYPGSVIKRFLKLDAICSNHQGGKRVATIKVPFDELEKYVVIDKRRQNFLDIDDPSTRESIHKFLESYKVRPSNFLYSHLEEKLTEGNYAKCGDHNVPFKPTGVIRMVVDDVSLKQRRDAEKRIVADFSKRLLEDGLIRHTGKLEERTARDLEAVLNVGKNGYEDLYSVFEYRRFFSTALEDVVQSATPSGLNVLAFFEGNDKKKTSKIKEGGKARLQKRAIESLEEIIKSNIKAPYEIFEWGVKSPESLATKILLHGFYPEISAGYDREGKENINAYLRKRDLPDLEEKDAKTRRDLRDLFRMKWVVEGDSLSYSVRERNIKRYIVKSPAREESAMSLAYDRFYQFGEIPDNYRGYEEVIEKGKLVKKPLWRNLGEVTTKDGILINFSSKNDVKDYIVNRKGSFINKKKHADKGSPKEADGFGAIKVYATYLGAGQNMPFEIMFMTNFFDTMNMLSSDAQHSAHKARNEGVIDYCLKHQAPGKKGMVTGEKIAAMKFLLNEALN